VASDSSAKVVKKKVRPYPIAATLEANAIKKPVEILQLVKNGMIVRLTTHMVTVGEYYIFDFAIPVAGYPIKGNCRVLKTYDRVLGPAADQVERLAEIRFSGLTETQTTHIEEFLRAIGQK